MAKLAEVSGGMYAVNSGFVPKNNELQKQFYDMADKNYETATDLEAALGAEATLEFTQQLSALALGKITPEQFCSLVEKKIDR